MLQRFEDDLPQQAFDIGTFALSRAGHQADGGGTGEAQAKSVLDGLPA
jgi:hypothetical protein